VRFLDDLKRRRPGDHLARRCSCRAARALKMVSRDCLLTGQTERQTILSHSRHSRSMVSSEFLA